MSALIRQVSDIVWSWPLVLFMFIVSVYFSIKYKFVQIRRMRDIKELVKEKTHNASGVSLMASFWTIMASRIGVGNIAGSVLAIYYGGPGAIVWMWITSILGAANSFVECTLGQYYKVKVGSTYIGGTFYYAEKGLGWKKYATVMSLLTVIVVAFCMPAPQTYAISEIINFEFSIPMWISSLIGSIILFVIINGGIKRISEFASRTVPLMIGIYMMLGFYIIFQNFTKIDDFFSVVLSSAIGKNAIFGGMVGSAISWGVRRATFSSAAGMGEAVPASAAAETTHPIKQGIINALGCYVDVIICTFTALIVCLSDCFAVKGRYIGQGLSSFSNAEIERYVGTQFVGEALAQQFGVIGGIIISIIIFLFAFTTILNYYYQSESAVKYLVTSEEKQNLIICILRILISVLYFVYGISENGFVWNLADLGFGVMIWMNLVLIVGLRSRVDMLLSDYEKQKKMKLNPIYCEQEKGESV